MHHEQLTENLTVRQRDDEGYRKWYLNSYFDLIVWYSSKGGALIGFQICYSRNFQEKAFTWTPQYRSNRLVSDTYFEKGVSHMSSGILEGEGGLIPENVIQKFVFESNNLEVEEKKLVVDKMTDYNAALLLRKS
ncbi:hypothetical protein K7J14_02620 [Treponema zuelzerae]|uniref:Uncharacterized protein n=1 Tax=Teretinema zuelzerae TaxID=156 RepID=A0AAE3JHC6_9SPIR|nr:hypothetical protein [Teretinema zuelzerae]MCD1653592.1 hypothetical protein [Teretinema zuelzerae]